MASVTINTGAKNFKVVLGHSPKDYDMAIVSVDAFGTEGALNSYVAGELGYEYLGLGQKQLSKGYHLLRTPTRKSILFIVTVGEGDSKASLTKNLEKALSANVSFLSNKNIWIPLMGTGTGGLEFVDSYNTTVGVIKKFSDLFFTISITNDTKGQSFINHFGIAIDNEVSSRSSSNHQTNQTNYFLGGHIWGENDNQANRFLTNGIWQNGHTEKDVEIVNSAKVGDIIFLKSTFAKNNISYLRIKAVGQIEKNELNGRELSVNWNQLKNFIDIEGLGKYRRTFSRVDAKDIELIKTKVAQNSPRSLKGTFFPSFDPPFTPIRLKEYQIDTTNNFFYGQEVGEEIKDYDVIILPKSSYGGVGNHSISTHILQLLGIDKDSLKFSEKNLIDHKYATHEVENKIFKKNYVLIFVVTRDQTKHHIQFDRQLVNAIENYRKSQSAFKYVQDRKHLKIFIPFLGTGQAGMPIDESFKNLIPGIRQLRKLDTPKSIRVNYPLELDDASIRSFNNQLLNEFNLEASQTVNDSVEEDLGLETELNGQDKIPFHLDQVVDEDKLGREPVAKAFVDLVKKDIFTDKLNYSFMVHLQGEWGSGKSSFLNFIKKHLNIGDKKWVVVEYNAWQNQHIDPPWWSLIHQVYRQSKSKMHWTDRPSVWFQEGFRRIIWYSGWHKIMALVVSIVFLILLLTYGKPLMENLAEINEKNVQNDKIKGITLEVFVKLIVSIGSLVGLLYSFSKYLATPLKMKSSGEAKSFMLRAADPMTRIKKHFNKLVGNINKQDYEIAIFIDDIDRCDKEFIVCLLEGIQTLFKEKRVLYIVAGDKNWITQSFGKVYEDFVSVGTSENQLGEFFLEKAFQLSFRLPNISEDAKQNYWQSLLGVAPETIQKSNTIEELSDTELTEVKQRIATSSEEITKPKFMKGIEEEYNLTQDAISDLVIEEKNKDQTEIKHLLTDYHQMIDSNPRAIIRLANNYTMTRSTLIAERREFTEQKLFRWLVIEDLCPEIRNHILLGNDETSIKEQFLKIVDDKKRKSCLKLFEGDKTEDDGLTLEDIKQIKGL